MADVFISYARADRPHASRIASMLEQHGWSVWWDRKILGGQSFEQAIQQALDEARCIIVLWSSASITSPWVKDEATEGTQRSILLPVLIGDVEIPLGFRQFQAVSLTGVGADTDSAQFEDLVAAVGHVLSRRAPIEESAHATPAKHVVVEAPSRPASFMVDEGGPAAERSRASKTVPRSYLVVALGVALLAIAAIWGALDRNGQVAVPAASSNGDAASIEPAAAASSSSTRNTSTARTPGDSGPATAPAREEAAAASGVLVSGNGRTLYYLYDATGATQLKYASTNVPIEVFAGDYLVSLNKVRRPVRVQKGRRSVLETGRVSTLGRGGTLFYVYEPKGKEAIAYATTDLMTELFPGDYVVSLNNVRMPAAVRPGQDTHLPVGRILVPGSGSTLYYVFDATGQKQLAYTSTNREVELFPGSYVVELNKLRQRVDVTAGRQTRPDQ